MTRRIRIRWHIVYHMFWGALLLVAGLVNLNRGIGGGSVLAYAGGSVFTIAAILVIVHHWSHWTELSDEGVEQFHWFGFKRRFVQIQDITAVTVKVEHRFDKLPVPMVRFRYPGGAITLNPYLWGDHWIDEMVTIMKDHGIPTDERLPLIQQTP